MPSRPGSVVRNRSPIGLVDVVSGAAGRPPYRGQPSLTESPARRLASWQAGSVTDWATIAEVGTAAGTLVLALATFASVRSSNRSARLAERSLLDALRPLLLPSRLQDPPEKVGFQDDHWIRVSGGMAIAEVTHAAIYLAISLRNVGPGLAVLSGWYFHPERMSAPTGHPEPEQFQRLTRDLYIPAGDTGFWQGTYRDPADAAFQTAADVISMRRPFTIDLLYSDGEGGQRIITRFSLLPARDVEWIASVSRHWNLDRPDPR
jgi:hypothetical protein